MKIHKQQRSTNKKKVSKEKSFFSKSQVACMITRLRTREETQFSFFRLFIKRIHRHMRTSVFNFDVFKARWVEEKMLIRRGERHYS